MRLLGYNFWEVLFRPFQEWRDPFCPIAMLEATPPMLYLLGSAHLTSQQDPEILKCCGSYLLVGSVKLLLVRGSIIFPYAAGPPCNVMSVGFSLSRCHC